MIKRLIIRFWYGRRVCTACLAPFGAEAVPPQPTDLRAFELLCRKCAANVVRAKIASLGG